MFNWGFVGSGGISRRAAKEISELDEANLLSVFSRDQKKSESFAKEFNVDRAYNNYKSFLQDPDLDIVYIGVPHHLHCEYSIQAMRAGKSVLCEKPLATNAFEVEKMIRCAKEQNVFLMEAMWTRFLPVSKKVRAWLDSGEIGNVNIVEASFGFKASFDADSRIFSSELAGGALLDVGVYPISMTNYYLNKYPRKIKASGVIGETGVDEQNTITFEYENCRASLGSSVIDETGEDMIICGDSGFIRIPFFWRAEVAELCALGGELRETIRGDSSFSYEAIEVMNCISNGKKESEVMPLSESFEIHKIMDEIKSQIFNSGGDSGNNNL